MKAIYCVSVRWKEISEKIACFEQESMVMVGSRFVGIYPEAKHEPNQATF